MSDGTGTTGHEPDEHAANRVNGTGEGLDHHELPYLDPRTAPVVTRVVRTRLELWDRIKIELLLVALWWVLLWADLTTNPIEPFGVAFQNELHSLGWLEILMGLELVRQLHYVISERSPRWHRFFATGVFGSLNRQLARIGDWNRYRIGRVFRVVVFLVILAAILGAFFHTSPLFSLFEVPAALYGALPFILQLAFGFFFVIVQFVGLFWFMSRGGVDVYYPGDVKARFSDVWGQDAVLERVKENIIFLKNPEAIESRGGYVPGGILLWGPPGTGKTLIAEAVAGETDNPFVFVDPGAFINMFMGIGILKVKSLFRKLRKLALRYGGVVVFFDEADSLGNRGALTPGGIFGRFSPDTHPHSLGATDLCNGMRYLNETTSARLFVERASAAAPATPDEPRRLVSRMMGMGMAGGGGMGTLQSLLSEIQGLSKPRGFINRRLRRILGMQPSPPPKYRILIMMATNMPNSLDEAMLRPGRIDRIYKVGYPSKNGRVRTYEGYFSKVANDLTAEDIERLATITPYATGATIKDLVNESLINAIRDQREVITWGDVVKAKQLKDLGPPEDVDYVERERHAVAVHEACHAVVAARTRRRTVIDLATIEKGGSYLGFVSQVRAEDTFTSWKSDYEADIMVSLASLAGEKMFFEGDNSSGVSGDLNSATTIATYMEGYWGMGQTITSHQITQEAGVGDPGRERRGERDMLGGRHLGERIEANLITLLGRTARLLEENRHEVLAVAHALEAHKTITGDDVLAIIDGHKGPIIDGRRYHAPEFLERAEAYHRQILEAHRTHSDASIPLPELPPAPDDLVVEEVGAPE